MSGKRRKSKPQAYKSAFKLSERDIPKTSYSLFRSKNLSVSASVDRGKLLNRIYKYEQAIKDKPVIRQYRSAKEIYRTTKEPLQSTYEILKQKL